MSTIMPSRPRMHQQQRRSAIAIVSSRYHPDLVEGLVSHATKEINAISADANIYQYNVPGAFEIPLMVQEVAERGTAQCIIALGVIIRGETGHADLIAGAISQSLLELSLRYRIPIIHEVLSLANEEQARKRCLEEEINRGTEAARAALRMIQALADLKGRA